MTRKTVSAHRTIRTFALLWSVSYDCFQRAENDENGRTFMLCASMVFSAFTVEAFLNHVGANRIEFWDYIERNSWRNKLKLFSMRFGISIDYRKRPFHTVKLMFQFRDALAHGKTKTMTEDTIQNLREGQRPTLPMTKWEKKITLRNAKLYLHDIDAVVHIFCDKANFDYIKLTGISDGGSISRAIM